MWLSKDTVLCMPRSRYSHIWQHSQCCSLTLTRFKKCTLLCIPSLWYNMMDCSSNSGRSRCVTQPSSRVVACEDNQHGPALLVRSPHYRQRRMLVPQWRQLSMKRGLSNLAPSHRHIVWYASSHTTLPPIVLIQQDTTTRCRSLVYCSVIIASLFTRGLVTWGGSPIKVWAMRYKNSTYISITNTNALHSYHGTRAFIQTQ